MKFHAIVLCAVALLPGAAQAASNCGLKQLASLPMSVDAENDMTIPLTIGGTEEKFAVGLNQPYSAIKGSIADSKGFRSWLRPHSEGHPYLDGESITKEVTIPDLQIGTFHGPNVHMLRSERADHDPDIAGLLALDFFSGFDVELDIKNNKLNLFSQDHCKGGVVYWSDTYSALPLVFDPAGHVAVRMTLDGELLWVDFDTSAERASMPMPFFKKRFGLNPQSPGMQLVGTRDGVTGYLYPFKSLSAGNVVVNAPMIVVQDGVSDCSPGVKIVDEVLIMRCYGMAELRLRMAEMKAFRLYFAYDEKMLYVTAADAAK